MEQLLHYTWKHKLYPLQSLQTTLGEPVEVLDVGLHNTDAGPAFFNAKVKIGGILWVGNVEMHMRSSDWYRHGHHKDAHYDSVVLHVVEIADQEVIRSNGERLPQLCLQCPAQVKMHLEELLATDRYPACYRLIPSLSPLFLHGWMAVLLNERFEQKRLQFEARLLRTTSDWEAAFFVTLARNFGFGINGDAFEKWASILPLHAVAKHRDQLFQIEAIFFGVAGLLQDRAVEDPYYLSLQREYHYLKQKFSLEEMDVALWKFLRLRPCNFPHVRIAQLAYLYFHQRALFSKVMETTDIRQLTDWMRCGVSDYWKTHYNFKRSSAASDKKLSDKSIHLVFINTFATVLYAYGLSRAEESLCARAAALLEKLKAEDNYIVRMWREVGVEVETAADSQALIQLKKEYCDPKKCLFCRIGYLYLKELPKK